MRTSDTAVTTPPVKVPKLTSLVAAASVLKSPNPAMRKALGSKPEEWVREAWRFYDGVVGELGFAAHWVGNGMSRVNLFAARPPQRAGDEPTPLDPNDETLTRAQRRYIELVASIAGGPAGQGQMLGGCGVHLTIGGRSFVVVEPDLNDPLADTYITWNVISSEELRMRQGAKPEDDDAYEVATGPSTWRTVHPNGLIIELWRKHPLRSWLPDSPTRRVLSVLREIEGYQLHKQSSIMSRLAGAGLLILPSETEFPKAQRTAAGGDQSGVAADDQEEPSSEQGDATSFSETLIDVASTAIGDRGSPAANVPVVVTTPGEYVDKIKFISFATPFDQHIEKLLEQAIRRFALGMDMPPELLLGVGGMNHWGAWFSGETGITFHIEPTAEIICHGLTTGWCDVVLTAEGLATGEAMVWYDTTDLRVRPDKTAQAQAAYEAGELSGAAYLRELGFSTDDAPTPEESNRRILLKLVATPVPELVPAILELLKIISDASILPKPQQGAPGGPPASGAELPSNGPPETDDAEPEEPDAMAAALIAACDGVVFRALERSGSRLRSAAGRGKGGAGAIPCDDVTKLHCSLDATAHDSLDRLLAGAWDRVPDLASRYGMTSERLTATLDAYVRALVASQQEHTLDRLANALGVPVAVG